MAATTSQRAHLNRFVGGEDSEVDSTGEDDELEDDAAANEDDGEKGESLSPFSPVFFSSSLVCLHMTCSAREWLSAKESEQSRQANGKSCDGGDEDEDEDNNDKDGEGDGDDEEDEDDDDKDNN